MKKLIPIFILIVGILVFTPYKCITTSPEESLDTFSCVLESGDSFYYVLDINRDTVDWWYSNKGIKFTKQQYEIAVKTTDSLLQMGYKKGFIND